MSKNSNTSSAASGGIGFIGLLTLLFIGLKLTHYIDWPWLWVLSPTWISCLCGVGIFLIVMVIMFIVALIKD